MSFARFPLMLFIIGCLACHRVEADDQAADAPPPADGGSATGASASPNSHRDSPGVSVTHRLSDVNDWEINLGDVFPDTISPITSTIINDTDRTIDLGTARASCSCLENFHAHEPILKPGESTVVSGIVHNLNRQGAYSNFVDFRQPNQDAKPIRLNILSNRSDFIADPEIQATALLGIDPMWGENACQFTVVRGPRTTPWNELHVRSLDPLIALSAETDANADTWTLSASLRDHSLRLLGPRRVWAEFTFGSHGLAIDHITRRSYALSIRGPVKANPENVILGVLSANETQLIHMRITSRSGAASAVTSVVSVQMRDANVDVHIVHQDITASGSELDIELHVRGIFDVRDGAPMPFPRMEAEVHTADGQLWFVSIPVVFGIDVGSPMSHPVTPDRSTH